MAQDKPICRFCLDSKNGKRNPLIDACECRGSIQYVHQYCLARWRRMDPARNGTICLLCFHPYKDQLGEDFEHIPQNTIVVFFLRYPFALCLAVNYVGIFHYAMPYPKPNALAIFEYYQYFFQIIYLCLFYSQWKVQQTHLYWSFWKTRTTFVIVLLHIFSNLGINGVTFFALLPLNIALNYYWRNHIYILERINAI